MKEQKFPHLFTPLVIRGKTIPNRVEAAPLSMGPVEKGKPPIAQAVAEVKAHSAGGMGLYTIGEVPVSDMGNRRVHDHFDFTDLSEENLIPYRTAAEIVKANGCIAQIELVHCGHRRPGEAQGPMAFTADDGTRVAAMTEADIEQVCEDFANAAYYMKAAGFDGIMGHFGHGWLIHQFISPLTNQRTDRFGGSLENRMRLPIMVAQRIRERVGEDFLIELRMSGDELCEGGYTAEDFVEIAKMMDPYADIIQVSMGLYGNPVQSREFPGAYHENGCNAYIAESIRKVLTHAKVSVVGAINDPALAEEIVASGKADLVAMCRQLFADAEFAKKAQAGRDDLIIPCLRCFCCFSGPQEQVDHSKWKPGCSVNPYHMQLEYLDMPAPEERKTILVAGGGVAGLFFAYTAQTRGHRVILAERSDRFGGILRSASGDPHKQNFMRYLDALEANAREAGATLLLNTVVDEALIETYKPDVIVAAVGAEERDVPLAGSGVSVLSAVGAMDRLDEIGSRVVIIGGGLIGAELAVSLHHAGREVTLTARSQILKQSYPLHAYGVRMELAKGVSVREGCVPVEVREEGILMRDTAGEKEPFLLEADTVILATGLEPRQGDVDALRKLAEGREFYSLGDCTGTHRIRDATNQAFHLAMELGTEYRPKPLKNHWN